MIYGLQNCKSTQLININLTGKEKAVLTDGFSIKLYDYLYTKPRFLASSNSF